MASNPIFESGRHGSLGTQIFELLRDRILNGDYERGDKLNELSLAKELNISRTPIREALKQLELEGLAESIPNKGVYVKGFSPRDIDDMFEIRIQLESLAIKLAIERMDDIHFAKIQEVFELMEFYTMKRDQGKLGELNILYHEMIYQSTQSPYFQELLSDIHYYVSVTSKRALRPIERLDTSLEEHREILNLIKERDAEGAIDVIKTHIKKTQMLVRKYYASQKK
ncbi:hypothetical protein IV49_GL001555 [Kandleria vitulina DSM 20405]|jgi:DNA-binding GntR family transcriptional regulator|uniref:HTH gntR-type domain-containing protein n=1 Tax=Kandleria vitulina DSM 20405 TaxID=1410657 RepID=A0A0R2H3Q4_9FIRM|nr:GntR family transcriptional regulator [Kandleria vitulina]KRN47426.1 hypothetical protein IV49_GL001555 [Kandleria vitulina DSM 20405]MEE0988988.1 GntR family transcriptional regulator [Kandleria vitulina]SEJ34434.1 transcriptional regulator, GntR family [Kandleria vitulina]